VNVTRIATIVTTPGADGYGVVSLGGVERACYFAPNRFVGFFTPAVSDRVLVTSAGNGIAAIALIGKGAPA
jgi:hypothetical protein